MNAELEILGVKLKHYRVDAAMEIAEEYLSNDKLNTIGIVTMQMLMQASKEPTWKQYIEDLDLTVIGETEVLEAAESTRRRRPMRKWRRTSSSHAFSGD